MRRTVGVLVMEHIAVGLVEDHKVLGSLSIFPEKPQSLDPLQRHRHRFSGHYSERRGRGFAQLPSSQGICLARCAIRYAERQTRGRAGSRF